MPLQSDALIRRRTTRQLRAGPYLSTYSLSFSLYTGTRIRPTDQDVSCACLAPNLSTHKATNKKTIQDLVLYIYTLSRCTCIQLGQALTVYRKRKKKKGSEACDHCLSWSVIIDQHRLSRFNQPCGSKLLRPRLVFCSFCLLLLLFPCLNSDLFFVFYERSCAEVFQQFSFFGDGQEKAKANGTNRRDHPSWLKNTTTAAQQQREREKKSDFLASSMKRHDEAGKQTSTKIKSFLHVFLVT